MGDIDSELKRELKAFADAIDAVSSKDTLAAAKEEAISQFIRRAKFAESHERYDNTKLPADSPVYVYCKFCGILIERLPEDYLFPPTTECSQCIGLKKQGWLDDAQRTLRWDKKDSKETRNTI